MHLNIANEVAVLKRLPIHDLRAKYAEVFEEPTRAGNRVWLVKRIAWRLQALAEGDLTQRARQRAAELTNHADLRVACRCRERFSPAATRARPCRCKSSRTALPSTARSTAPSARSPRPSPARIAMASCSSN